MLLTLFLVSSLLTAGCVAIPFRHHVLTSARPLTRIPEPDGMLHIYDLPTGQGDAHIIQCPSGDLTVFDLGAMDYDDYWGPQEVWQFVEEQSHLIRNVLVTHNHWDHYILLQSTFPERSYVPNLENIYISCGPEQMADEMARWVDLIDGYDNLRLFNEGNHCGTNGIDCESLDLCPSDPDINNKVMIANLGQQCTEGDRNTDCPVVKITYGDVSIMLTGDYEDFTTDWEEDGPQKELVDYYGDEMISTVYSLSHHGASSRANKPVFRDAIQPKAIFVSGNPFYQHRHPRCSVIDAFHLYVESLCKPLDGPGSEFYCGEHPNPGSGSDVLQSLYWCGLTSSEDPVLVDDNEWAVYTTIPDDDTINLIDFATDGSRWGFRNNYMQNYC